MGRLTKFFAESALVQAFTCNLPPIERWALNNSGKCSPDEIIAAAIIQSLASDFDDWVCATDRLGEQPFSAPPSSKARIFKSRSEAEEISRLRHGRSQFSWYRQRDSVQLVNKKKDINFSHGWARLAQDDDDAEPWLYVGGSLVNGIEFDFRLGAIVAARYKELKNKQLAAKQTAAKAKANMERNEAAWNLAEKLLGMTRNEHGALVPIKTVEVEESKAPPKGVKRTTIVRFA